MILGGSRMTGASSRSASGRPLPEGLLPARQQGADIGVRKLHNPFAVEPPGSGTAISPEREQSHRLNSPSPLLSGGGQGRTGPATGPPLPSPQSGEGVL